MTRNYRENQEPATALKWGYYYPLQLFMGLTAKDCWWQYPKKSDRNLIDILHGTYINQEQFVLKNTAKVIANKQDIDVCLEDVYIFDTPTFQHMWDRRMICGTAAIMNEKFQYQIKKLLWQNVKKLKKENKILKQEKLQLQKEIEVLLKYCSYSCCRITFLYWLLCCFCICFVIDFKKIYDF